jgi:hypothetical protein
VGRRWEEAGRSGKDVKTEGVQWEDDVFGAFVVSTDGKAVGRSGKRVGRSGKRVGMSGNEREGVGRSGKESEGVGRSGKECEEMGIEW